MWYVTLSLSFGGATKPFSTVAALFYIPTFNVCGFQCLHVVVNTRHCRSFHSHASGCEAVPHYSFGLCFSSNDVEHLFIHVLAICMSSLEKYL